VWMIQVKRRVTCSSSAVNIGSTILQDVTNVRYKEQFNFDGFYEQFLMILHLLDVIF